MGFSPVFKIKAFSHNCLPLCSCQSYLWWAWPLQSPDLSCPPKLLVQPLMLILPSQLPLPPLGLFYHFLSKNILYTCITEPSKRQIVVKIWSTCICAASLINIVHAHKYSSWNPNIILKIKENMHFSKLEL